MNLSLKSVVKSSLMIIGACVVLGEVKSCVDNPDKYYNKVKKNIQKTEKNIDKAIKSVSSTKSVCDFNLASANYAKGIQMVKNSAVKLV